MDIHKNYSQVAVLDGKGINNDLSKVGRFFNHIGGSGNSGRDVKVVMESFQRQIPLVEMGGDSVCFKMACSYNILCCFEE